MAARFAWVLNLDADLELAAGPGYAPTASVLRSMGEHQARLAASLLGAGDVLIDDTRRVDGLVGRAFCPTPRAIAALVRAGVEPEPHPTVEVLRRVSSRAFSAALGPTMPHAAFVTDLGEARAMLASDPELGDAWRIKRAFGMAGRGHRVVAIGPRDVDVAFLARWIASGGVQIEPNVKITVEYAQHGLLAEDRSLRVGVLTRQRTDARGAWLASEVVGPGEGEGHLAEVRERIADEVRGVARALSDAGYFGPFGVDAFTYEDHEGRVRLQPRSEINARYSMGFAVGFGRPS
jgi:hypothetical protein